MKQTLAQKLVARAAGRSTVTPGEIVTCKVDLAMMHDSGGPRRVKPLLERLGGEERVRQHLRFGLNAKGDIAEGMDADIVLVDPKENWTIRAADSASTQGYTPFEGIELSARVKATFLRGALVCENGNVVGQPRGKYLHRPTA
jgi:N-acyl-D-aspartate/D-glutamate deacylase